MRTLWYILWIAMCVMVFVIIPFSIFLYEGDEEKYGYRETGIARGLVALFHLEEEEAELRERFPQGEEAEMFWAMTVLVYIGKLIFGVIGLAISVAWIVHIILYMLIQPPASAFLNDFFVTLDRWWGLLGTGAFSIFCFYLFLAVISGEMYLGLNILILSIHPMRWSATLMSSFLFNVALILCCATR
ncbi:unnamed protein product [Closterium sp. NIES-64]|nr:unnamed protein product [Closterium sp. NIES-64]